MARRPRRLRRRAVAALLAVLLWPGAMHGYEPVDAKPLIEAFWAISEEKRASGVTGTMRYGATESVDCLEKVVIEQVRYMFHEVDLPPAQAQKWLDQMNIGHMKLYWAIYNDHRGCNLMCGTMYQLFHLPAHADVLEKIIRDMVDVRNEYKMGPKQ